MRTTKQAPYVLLSVLTFFLVGSLANFICGSPGIAGVVACIAAGVVWMIGRDKAQKYESEIEDPPARLFAASDFDVFAAIKEVMADNIGDKHWITRIFDDAPDEDGYMKAKFVMTYREQLNSNPPVMLDRQLSLDVRVKKVASHTSVKLDYQVASERFRWTANDILEYTTAMIWERLEKLGTQKRQS